MVEWKYLTIFQCPPTTCINASRNVCKKVQVFNEKILSKNDLHDNYSSNEFIEYHEEESL